MTIQSFLWTGTDLLRVECKDEAIIVCVCPSTPPTSRSIPVKTKTYVRHRLRDDRARGPEVYLYLPDGEAITDEMLAAIDAEMRRTS